MSGRLIQMQTQTPTTIGKYFQNIWDTLFSTAVGMRITARHFFQKPITVQYPDEVLPIPDRFRGVHYLEQEKCIDCLACARACPIDCIEMDAVRHGKELEWVKFTIDYNKCMFCELCVYPCPKDCIHMGKEFAFVVEDRKDLVYDLLSYRGMDREARVRMKEAAKKKKEKAAAKKAKEEAEAKKAAEEGGDAKPADEPKAKKKPDAEKKGDAEKKDDGGEKDA